MFTLLLKCGTWQLALAVICGPVRLAPQWRGEIQDIPSPHRDNDSPGPSLTIQSLSFKPAD